MGRIDANFKISKSRVVVDTDLGLTHGFRNPRFISIFQAVKIFAKLFAMCMISAYCINQQTVSSMYRSNSVYAFDARNGENDHLKKLRNSSWHQLMKQRKISENNHYSNNEKRNDRNWKKLMT